MNRTLKKAVSFLAAAAVSISTLAAGSVGAYAASSDVKTTQVLKNQYNMYVALEDSIIFAKNAAAKTEMTEYGYEDTTASFDSKTSFVMINNKGKKVSVKNTIGFDKMYTVGTHYDAYSVGMGMNRGEGSFIIVGKGDKKAAILSNGKYLAKGKYFDSVKGGDYITAVSGKTTYFYSEAGKLLGKASSNKVGTCIDYDKAAKTFLTESYTEVTDEYGYSEKDFSYHIVKGGKIVKTFDADFSEFRFEKVKKTTYVYTEYWDQDKAEYVTKYYTVKGKEAKVSASEDEEAYNLTVKQDTDAGVLTVTDKKGKEILSYKIPDGVSGDYVYNKGKWIISCGGFYIIDDATGKIETKNTDKTFMGIDELSKSNDTFVLAIGTETTDEYGTYYTTAYQLFNSKGKSISASYDSIYPTDVDYSSFRPTYSKTSAFEFSKDYKYGLMSSKGKVIVKPSYDYTLGSGAGVAAMSPKFDWYSNTNKAELLNIKTGKKLATVDCVVSIQFGGPFQNMSSDTACFITSNKDGSKFGCIVIKN